MLYQSLWDATRLLNQMILYIFDSAVLNTFPFLSFVLTLLAKCRFSKLKVIEKEKDVKKE